MNYVSFVRGNLKGLPEEGVALGPKTLIIAPSRRGKSRIANAVTLALEGFVEDVAGAAVLKQGAELASLAPGRDGRLWAETTISDGRTASFSMIAKDGGSKDKKHNGIPGACPLPSVREALTGSADKAYSFLIGTVIGASLGLADVVARVGADKADAVKHAVAAAPGATAALRTLAARDDAKRALAEARKAEKTAKAALEALQGSAGLAPTEETVGALRRAYEAAVAYDGACRAMSQVAHYAGRKQSLTETLTAEREKLAAMPEGVSEAARAKIAASRVLVDAAKTDACPLCRTEGGAAKAAAIVVKAEAIVAAQSARTRQAATVERIAKELTEIEARLARAQDIPPPNTGNAKLDEALRGADELRRTAIVVETRDRYEAAKKAFDSLGAIQRQKALQAKAAADVATADTLLVALESAIEQLVETAIADFTRRVRDYLPADMPFGCSLKAGERRTFEIGLINDDGVLHTALSGAEWSYVMLAVTLAVKSGDLTVCIPEERAVDPKTLGDVMRALTAAPAQVILTSVVKPAGKMPSGWTVIELGDVGEKPKRGRPKKDAPTVAPAIAEHARQVEAFADDLDEATGALPTLEGDPDGLEA